jgi:hypothetical protein
MNDRELLEAAAKAAGITLMWSTMGGIGPRNVETGNTWSPLVDDGDALRLAVKLAMEIRPGIGMVTAAGDGVWEEVDTGNHTREEATRRAIVRAAAALA